MVFVNPRDAELKRMGTRVSRPAGLEGIDCDGLVSMLRGRQLVAPGAGVWGHTGMPEKAWTDPDTGFVAGRALGATEPLAHDAHNRRVLALYGGVVVVSAAYVDSDHSVQYEANGVTYYFCGRRSSM